MSKGIENKGVLLSQKLFQRLLTAYPRRHREEYGAAMAQLFRDQCRDAWSEAGGWGLVKLWLRVLPDLVKTSLSEHLASLKEKGSIMKKLTTMLHAVSLSWAVFAVVFVSVFIMVLGTSALVTFIMPRTYTSMARIKIATASNSYDPYAFQTASAVMQSEAILDKVIEDLGLNTVWAKKFNIEGGLRTEETRKLLRNAFETRPTRNSSLIEIRAYSEKPDEAATLANAVAKAYKNYESAELRKAMTPEERRMEPFLIHDPGPAILDTAEPNPRAVRPNIPLNIFLGGVVGTFAALLAGGAAVWIASVSKRGRTAPAR
jgi:capsular polysaccharide biosynthesis protein